jgi:hypothetical protein
MIVQQPQRRAFVRRRSSRQPRTATPAYQQAGFLALLAVVALGIVGTGFAALATFGSHGAAGDPTGHADSAGVLALGAGAAVADVGAVGETFAYANGVTVTVRRLRLARASGRALGARAGQPIVVAEIDLVNNSRGSLAMVELQVSARVGEDRQAEEVVDPGSGPPRLDGELRPGQRATGSYAFALERGAEAEDVAIELAPGYAYRWATFEGVAR